MKQMEVQENGRNAESQYRWGLHRTLRWSPHLYVEKYYLNEQFSGLPESIKQELQIMCVMYTEDIGGIILLEFMPDGRLQFKVEAEENDYLFDEIGSALKIKQYQAEKRELLESLELYYKVKVLGIPADELLDDEQMERYQED